MTTTTSNMIYIGTAPGDLPIMDPDGTGVSENANAITGLTFGNTSLQITSVDLVDNAGGFGDGQISEDGTVGPGGDYLTYDLGGGSVSTPMDSVIFVMADILLGDGSTVTRDFLVVQAANGDTFLAEEITQLDGLNIQSITITTMLDNAMHIYGVGQSITGSAIVCFEAGTRIATPQGPRRVDSLCPGDLVRTLDGGAQPIRYVHRQSHPWSDKTAPVRIAPGALGPGRPDRALFLSPHHRVLCRSKLVRRMFDVDEVLIDARHLVGLPGITRVPEGEGEVRYINLELDQHAILLAEGTYVESCLRGTQTLRAYPRLLRVLHQREGMQTPCRLIPEHKKQQRFAERAMRNKAALCVGPPIIGSQAAERSA